MKKIIIFDLDNTFYSYEKSHQIALNEVFKKQKIYNNYKIFQNDYEKSKKIVKTQLGKSTSKHNRVLYFKKLLEINKLNPILANDYEKLYWSYFIKQTKIDPRVYNLLEILLKQKAILHLYTNLDTKTQLKKLKYWNLNYFDLILTSEDVGSEKPSKKFIDLASSFLLPYYNDNYTFFSVGDDIQNDIKPWKIKYNSRTYLINNKQKSMYVDFHCEFIKALELIINY